MKNIEKRNLNSLTQNLCGLRVLCGEKLALNARCTRY
jgi:hypothetical protein